MEDTQPSKLIQEGSYGCAYTPPLPCRKSKLKKRKSLVGKITKRKEAKVELSIGTLIEGISGHSRYFITETEDNCDTKNFSFLRKTYSQTCEVYDASKDKNLIQLISSFGGRSLESTPVTSRFNFVGIFRHLLEGIVLLHKQDICHSDIHEGNILIDAKGTARYIDFGASFIGHMITEETIQNHKFAFTPSFNPQAPELAVQNALQDNQTVGFAIFKIMENKKIIHQASNVLGMNIEKQRRSFEYFWRTNPTTDWVSFYKTYWKGFDAWSLGVLMLKVLMKCFFIHSFVETTWRKSAIPITRVVQGLLQMNPKDRMSVDQALELWKTIS
jgi:serine/threonine protein kinase